MVCQAEGVDPAEPGAGVALPDPALVVLVGPSGSGKSAWAAQHYRPQEVVSSDRLRSLVGSGEHDLDASADAFALLDQIVAARLRRGLTAVVDTLGLDPAQRRGYLELARNSGMPAVAVLLGTDPAECRRRNRARDYAVPAPVLENQLRRMRAAVAEIPGEGWDLVTRAETAQPEASHTPGARTAASEQRQRPVKMSLVLQLSRFPWDGDPAGPAHWLAAVARAAAEARLQGIALMDHLIQIPQVGRVWEPIPEPWVTLGMLAGLEPGLRLGTLVTPVTFRAPGILAKTVATLDALSGGRSFCGIGAGWWAREHAGFGLPFPPARARFDELESAIETLRALWQPGTKEHRSDRVWLPGSAMAAIFPLTPAPLITSSPSCASTAWPPGAIPRRSKSRCSTSRSSVATASTSPRSWRSCAAIPAPLSSPGAITPARPATTSAATGCWPSAACGRCSFRSPTWPARRMCSA